MAAKHPKPITASLFWIEGRQAVRLPKELQFKGDTVLVRREGNAVILEPDKGWPDGYVESFSGISDDFDRPEQGVVETRRNQS